MTRLVVDASVVLKWYLDEEGTPLAEALQEDNDIIAPDLVIAETINGLWKAVRQKLIPRSQIDATIPVLDAPFAYLASCEFLYARAWEIALTLDHPAYDAFYIALAEREKCTFVTADNRLIRKVKGTRFARTVKALQA